MRLIRRSLGLASVCFVTAACIDSHVPAPEEVAAGATASASIGPEGGALALGDATLQIPPGALAATVELRAVATDDAPPAGFTAFSRVYRFEPDGLAFAVPAVLEIPFSGSDATATIFWTGARDGSLVALPTTTSRGLARAEVRHFSEGFVGTACAGEGCCRRASSELDLLLVMDDSNSMAEEQRKLRAQLPRMARALATGDLDADGVQDFPAVASLSVGVVSTDMGTGGFRVPTCGAPEFGQDAILRTSGDTSSPGCVATYPSVLTYTEGASDPDAFASDVACVASLGIGGCGFEQQLEAMMKAVAPSTMDMTFAYGTRGHGDGRNAGFVRDGSILALVTVTDEDDASAADAELFNPASAIYPGDLNTRAYAYPEALHPVGRYADGLRALRADPSSIVYATISGTPADLAGGDYDAILADPRMTERVDPTAPRLVPSCETPDGLAFPPRRQITLARELERTGIATVAASICAPDFSDATGAILARVADRLAGACD